MLAVAVEMGIVIDELCAVRVLRPQRVTPRPIGRPVDCRYVGQAIRVMAVQHIADHQGDDRKEKP